jgi:predicted CoA-binding protein
MTGHRLTSDPEIRDLLESVQTIAVIGLSPRAHRPSHRVARYLQEAGYRIVPVHPEGGTNLGETVYGTLSEVVEAVGPVDLVNVFRQPRALPGLLPQVAAIGCGVAWLQLGVVHPEAEAAALAGGLDLIVDRCMLVDHRRLVGQPF